MIVAVAAAALPSIAQMRWSRRVLIVSAPARDDPALLAQRAALSGWENGAADRDLTVVEVIGSHVDGARDDAAALRRHAGLESSRFAVALIGKDGHVALRSTAPLRADRLQGTIDAMPMRRAGQR